MKPNVLCFCEPRHRQDLANWKQNIFIMKTTFISTSWRKQCPMFYSLQPKKTESTKTEIFKSKFYRKILSFYQYLCLVLDTLAKCGIDNKQKMLKRKENFKCYGINTRPAKNRQVLYSYKKFYSRFIGRNFSVNS